MRRRRSYKEVNVAAQEEDEVSVLSFYRKAIALRKELSCVRHAYIVGKNDEK